MIASVVGIVGLGAIGGSIGLRARRNGSTVLGADRNSAAVEQALERGAIDRGAPAADLPGRAGILVLAPHLDGTLAELERLRQRPGPVPELILDVASVKVPVVRAAAGLKNFVATHPMAGSERSGIAAARDDLFEGRPWAYVPSGDAPLDARACRFIGSLGGVPIATSAAEHDRAVALSSHVPQVVAWCYARLIAGSPAETQPLCGPVARELLRIAGMRSAMWRDVLRANADNVERELRRLAGELMAAAEAIASGREDLVEKVAPPQ